MVDLDAIFGALCRHHVATPAHPLPDPEPGVTWLWAGDGIFKRGVNAVLDGLVRVNAVRTPGLATLMPHLRYRTHSGRIPGCLLDGLLDHARRAAERRGDLDRPIEQQYFVTHQVGAPQPFQVEVPAQQATATAVRYELATRGAVLVDLHSHHQMGAYFSTTDDRDDDGLGVSAVVGRIFGRRPEIAVRLNVYGHHQLIPALWVFDALPDGMRDTLRAERGYDAVSHH